MSIPAVPPTNYKGTQADWVAALFSRGYKPVSNDGWHGDIELPDDVWWEILEECERGRQ